MRNGRLAGCLGLAVVASACHSEARPDATLSDAAPGSSDAPSDAPSDSDAGSLADAAAGADAMATEFVVTLATSIAPYDIAVDATHVYWTDSGFTFPPWGTGAVMRVPKQGGVASVIAAHRDWPTSLVLDDTHVYWTEGSQVMRVAKDGTDLKTLVEGDYGGPFALAMDSSSVYWLNLLGEVMTVPKAGGTPLVLDDGTTWGPGGLFAGIAVDGTHVYWNLGSWTMRVAKVGGEPEVFSEWYSGVDLAVDDTHVYGAGWKIRKADGAAMNLCWPCDPFGPVALDETSVYWADYGDLHQLVRVAKSGGTPPEVIVDGMFYGQVGLAVDEAFLYWPGDDGASILRVVKN